MMQDAVRSRFEYLHREYPHRSSFPEKPLVFSTDLFISLKADFPQVLTMCSFLPNLYITRKENMLACVVYGP
jgi:hypothetical protein